MNLLIDDHELAGSIRQEGMAVDVYVVSSDGAADHVTRFETRKRRMIVPIPEVEGELYAVHWYFTNSGRLELRWFRIESDPLVLGNDRFDYLRLRSVPYERVPVSVRAKVQTELDYRDAVH